ncbi:MAG: GNAT family N-acetyltransferase [Firmicutes bacterium]|nr:GNAT family N-acetyltransferase [Bacillota bacterium]
MTRAAWPEPMHLEWLSGRMESIIDEGVTWSELQRTEKAGVTTRVFSFERDSHRHLNHPEHYLSPTHLKLQFCPAYNLITIDFICLPESDRGKGEGTRLLGYIEELAASLGYQALTLSSMLPAEHFWQKNGFQVLDEENHYYPRAMIKPLVPDLDPEQILCQL